jgi:DNA-binding NarL/FixJ family response regulator
MKITNPIRIVLVDNHNLTRSSLRTFLEANPLFKIVADYADGPTAISETLRHSNEIDILLVDISMAPLNGFKVTERLLKKIPALKIIGVSLNNEPLYAQKMLAIGARGYITKTSPIEEINQIITDVFAGHICICEEIRLQMPPEI